MGVGGTLRRAREEKGLTLERLSSVTRIKLPILVAIERNDPRGIPPRPFGRGFVRSYASEVGLDPDQTVREFFAQFAPEPTPEPPPAPPHRPFATALLRMDRRTFAICAGVLLCLLIALAFIRPGTAHEPAAAPRAVGTSGTSPPSPAAAEERRSAQPSPREIVVVLEATGPSWVRADVDGHRVIYGTLKAGDHQVLRGKQAIRIRTGDAGALRWQVGERPAALMGRPGQTLTTTVTTADARH